jgi:TonB-linked SusC/RagA family outer membrane protein
MKGSKILALLLALIVSVTVNAQDLTATGVVKDDMGEPVVGASVVQVGNRGVGTITDIDGRFQLKVPRSSQLQISYIGFTTQTVNAGKDLVITLKDDNTTLNDVVVIGYGVQKKSVVTAAIAKVSSEDIAGKGLVRMDNALKGLAAGVQVTSNSGQPGEGARVRIRGIGTINNSDPLYIVDGMAIDGGLDFVNPNDIESIEVLKDAASGAIYGARAANGVILVTTKRGKSGRAHVTYNASWGWSTAAKKRDVTSAADYAILQNEFFVNGGSAPKYADPFNLKDSNGNPINGFGTDWQDLVFNDNAPQQNHDVSISGASETVNYYASVGYYESDGIVGGNYGQSNYDRLTLNSNTQMKLMDFSQERNFLNKADLSVKVAYMNAHGTGISTNSEFGSILGSALYMSPLLAPTVTGDAGQAMIQKYAARGYELPVDANGNPYAIPGDNGTYQEMNNPLAMLAAQNPTKGWSHKFVPSFSLDIQLWDNIKFRSSFSVDMSFWGNDGAVKSLYYFSGNNKQEHTSASAYKAQNSKWQIENVLMYDKKFGKHTIGVVLGQSASKAKGNYLSGNRWLLQNVNKPSIDYATGDIEYSYITDADGNIMKFVQDGNGNFIVDPSGSAIINGATVQHGTGGGFWAQHRLASIFGRVSYNYDERYMIQATLRRDGSSRFGANHKYGTFPSVSVGWNVMNEEFMADTKDWLSNLKLRASWGKNGNENIGDFNFTAYTAMNNNYLFGTSATKYIGSKASIMANPDLRWEESEQTDIGVDLGFFNSALTLSIDYFSKKTNGMIIERPIPSYCGENKPQANVGDMTNSGVEFELGYKWHIADAKFGIKANVSYLHNKLDNLGNADGFVNYDGVQGLFELNTRAENGQPFPFFYGYKTAGILQNAAEAAEYNEKYGKSCVPGDVRFVDVNNDGVIDPNDRTNIGNGTPDWTFGISFNAEWKGFDFSIFAQGVQGADILDATYRTDVYSGNYPTWMLGRWTGEGTSNKYPRISQTGSYNWVGSDLYVCDGSYFRIKTMQLGYTLPRSLTKKAFIERLRLYVSADNLVTWTKYWGFDPEIASGGKSLGVDRGVYPQARTWTVGFNLTF